MWNAKNYCRQKSKKSFAMENVQIREPELEESPETREDCPEMVFINPEDYAGRKLRMLQVDMCINPDPDEIAHLYSLKTRGEIDRAVASIIDRHWI